MHRIAIMAACVAGAGLMLAGGCEQHDEPVGSGGWLTGNPNEKLDTLTGHIGGFSPAMKEVGYRFTEMYFAGGDGNWDYAAYHAQKIGDAIERGFERRPGRADSDEADEFMNIDLPAVREAISLENADTFRSATTRLIASCNACHRAEGVEFIRVVPPAQRLTPTAPPE